MCEFGNMSITGSGSTTKGYISVMDVALSVWDVNRVNESGVNKGGCTDNKVWMNHWVVVWM
jgi:hypothetical protein